MQKSEVALQSSHRKVSWKQAANLQENIHAKVWFRISHFGMAVLLQICCIFLEHLFLRTSLEGCFWILWDTFSLPLAGTFYSQNRKVNCIIYNVITIVIDNVVITWQFSSLYVWICNLETKEFHEICFFKYCWQQLDMFRSRLIR